MGSEIRSDACALSSSRCTRLIAELFFGDITLRDYFVLIG